MVNVTINYTDPNGFSKQRYVNTSVSITSVENLTINIISDTKGNFSLAINHCLCKNEFL